MENATYEHCQSCGMPMCKDPDGGGTEADGSKSQMYCSRCYQGGNFVWPDATLEQMQAMAKKKIQEQMHLPGFIAGWFTRGMPKLKRWAK